MSVLYKPQLSGYNKLLFVPSVNSMGAFKRFAFTVFFNGLKGNVNSHQHLRAPDGVTARAEAEQRRERPRGRCLSRPCAVAVATRRPGGERRLRYRLRLPGGGVAALPLLGLSQRLSPSCRRHVESGRCHLGPGPVPRPAAGPTAAAAGCEHDRVARRRPGGRAGGDAGGGAGRGAAGNPAGGGDG